MEHQIVWEGKNEPSLEHLRLQQNDFVAAEGMIIGVAEEQPFRLHYEVRCDAHYRFIMARVSLFTPVYHTLLLTIDADGFWRTDKSDMPLAQLHNCVDIDISATPFTNTLPIRRLGLQPGESTEIRVAYIAIPSLQLSPALQRYTCLAQQPDHSLYRFESPADDFTADIQVDQDGLVVEYPGLFRRVWMG
ncbi:MAG TPA: putative glycolipid-binding domain-containing protein [Anaerolineae bacterium]|nr:putative glycolipid-binding domain-containing protein [Anaerolineae bacterium]